MKGASKTTLCWEFPDRAQSLSSLIHKLRRKKKPISEARFKRRTTVVLSWLDFSTTWFRRRI